MNAYIKIIPIGIIRTSANEEEIKNSYEGVEGIIEIFEEFSAGLEGIDGFSHLIIVFWMDKVSEENRKTLKVKHRRLLRFGFKESELGPEVGVFCTDSPHRPNPIGITIVELINRKGRFLKVKGLDAFDGTPVIDIKPYTYDRRVENIKVPTWFKDILEKLRIKGIKMKNI
ncbi:MAG: tRNA (N6-threonylcarbamoyladenosine(37)-N6)-methyltransferase TrmO [Nitrososphaerota archaeon]